MKRGLTRVLALVFSIVFALSTFHVHGHAGSSSDSSPTVITAIDDGGQGADRSPDGDGRHAATDCAVCAFLSHILGSVADQSCDVRLACKERVVSGSEAVRAPPLFERDRPPIARAV